MICSLLIMMIIFINGIENAKQRVKHLDTVWKEDDADAKTKAWLLMVESGKVDEEELRRITPKSIFIAPLLSNRREKCQEGYRFDHLGQCVKVIKPDQGIQLELLLKKLNSLYANNAREKEEEEETGISQPSSGPLQFSIPILNEDEKELKSDEEDAKPHPPPFGNASFFVPEKSPELIPYPVPLPVPVPASVPVSLPVPLPILMLNRTLESNVGNETRVKEEEELEFSGSGPLFNNDTEPFITSGFEESDIASGDYMPEEEMTTINGLFIDDAD